MKNKIAITILAVGVAAAFALGATGILKPVLNEKEESGTEVDRPIGYLVIRSDVGPFAKEEGGIVNARCVDVPAQDDLPAYKDYVFDIDKAYGAYEYTYENCYYMHLDPEFSGAKTSLDIADVDGVSSVKLGSDVNLLVSNKDSVKYFVNSVYQKPNGDVYAKLENDANLNSDGTDPEQDVTAFSTYTTKVEVDHMGEKKGYISEMKISFNQGALPDRILLQECDDSGKTLATKEFTAATFAETFEKAKYETFPDCAYIVMTVKTGTKVRREIIERGMYNFSVLAYEEDGIFVERFAEMEWK